jgi:hypothetical protein
MISYVTLDAEVGYVSYGSHSIVNSGFSRVVKINKWGHIRLENGLEFDKLGYSRDKNFSRRRLIEPQTLRRELADQVDRRERAQLVRGLISKLEGSFSYSGTPHISPELRQELLEMVNKL